MWASAALFLCAVLAKEVAVALPLVAAPLLARRPAHRGAWRGTAVALLPFLLAGLTYLALRSGAMLATPAAAQLPTTLAFGWQTPAWLLTSLVALISPYLLLPHHQLSPLPPTGYLLLLGLLTAGALFTALLGRARRWDAPVLLGAGLLLLTLLPSAPLLPRGGALVAARFLYLPSAGLCLLVGCALAEAGARLPRRLLPTAVAAFVGVVACLGATTFSRTRDWRDDRTLVSSTLARDPGNWMMLWMRGSQLVADKRYPEAERLLDAALRLDPSRWEPKIYLGEIYEAQGRWDAAERLYRSLLSEPPAVAARAWFGLGAIGMHSGRDGGGEQEFLQALRLNPAIVQAHLNLGLIAYRRGDLELTTRRLEAGLALEPDNPHLLNGLGITARDRGDYRAARAHLRRALEVLPSFASAREALAGLPPDP